MGHSELKDRIIHTKRGAVIALCCTGFIAALSFQSVLSPSQHRPHWIVDLHFVLPRWADVGINVVFYACLAWGSAVFYRSAQFKERFLVGGWVTAFFLGLLQNLVSAPAVIALNYVKALAMLVALLATVDILLRMPASGYPRLDSHNSRNA
jgi:hypothetical protein